MLQLLFAFLAGAVTIAGPCILPLLPIILGTSTVKAHKARPVFIILGFILSFTVFVLLFATLGQALNIDSELFRKIAAVLIGLFGITMLFPKIQSALFARLEPLMHKIAPKTDPNKADLWSGFILGVSLGLVWSPCAGPVLGSILTLVVSNQSLLQSGILLFAYSLGAGIPMLLIAYGGQAATTNVQAIAKHAVTIQRIFGLLILLVAIGLYTGLEAEFQAWLIQNYPWLFPNLNFNL
ncbi:cytochrome c biogenesis protein CcdA [Candidatus Uhrbacteria bacterium]|nr:cytochrome c biogenesis protein CcdA [Candidatus Uhrbacteria bacterium]MBD3284149.1 cytochrome c biogenesis protein CcdA [Candidatus Uhrbacteria bacterium]